MKICTGMLTAAAALALWNISGLVYSQVQWEYALAPDSVVESVVSDGRGGAVVCYAIAASNAAYVAYLDKAGTLVWQATQLTAVKVSSHQVTKKLVVTTTTLADGSETLQEFDSKTGRMDSLRGVVGDAYTTALDVVAANKDSKGFFVVGNISGGSMVIIYRYSYK